MKILKVYLGVGIGINHLWAFHRRLENKIFKKCMYQVGNCLPVITEVLFKLCEVLFESFCLSFDEVVEMADEEMQQAVYHVLDDSDDVDSGVIEESEAEWDSASGLSRNNGCYVSDDEEGSWTLINVRGAGEVPDVANLADLEDDLAMLEQDANQEDHENDQNDL